MLLPTSVRYSIRMLIELRENEEPMTLAEISKRINVSEGYLKHLATTLGKAGIISCKKGPSGGCKIAKRDTTLLDLMRVFNKDLTLAPCLDGDYKCTLYDKCEARYMWKKVHDYIDSIFESITLEQF